MGKAAQSPLEQALSHESSLVYILTAGSRSVLWGGDYSVFTQGKTSEDLMLPAQKDGKVLLKFVKTQDGLTFLTPAACGTFAPVNGVSSP